MRRQTQYDAAEFLWRRGCECEDRGDINGAVNIHLKAAKLGHSAAQSNLGNLLDDKVDPPRPKEAVYWYKRAIKQGDCVGAWNLAMHYRNFGKERWYLHWLRAAAALGDEEAQILIRKLDRQNLRRKKS